MMAVTVLDALLCGGNTNHTFGWGVLGIVAGM